MLKSMTAYGKAETFSNGFMIFSEIRGLNSKHLDIKLNIPKEINYLTVKIITEIKKTVKRGRIDVLIKLEPIGEELSFRLNYEAAKKYLKEIRKLESQTLKEIQVNLKDLFSIQGIFKKEETNLKKVENEIIKTVRESLKSFKKEGIIEGQKLKEELEERISNIKRELKKIESIKEKINEELFEKIKSKVRNLVSNIPEELERRIELEVVMLSEKQDISEEISRLNFHLKRFEDLLETEYSGKTLDFLCQEMNREANTISSKLREISIVAPIINIKSEIAKIKEQVQNVE